MTKKIKEPKVIVGAITLAEAKNPKLARERRVKAEAIELAAKKEKAKANIQRQPRKQTMAQRMEVAALGRQTEQEKEQGKMYSIPAPNGSIHARVEPERIAHIIELSWTINYREKLWADNMADNGIEEGDKWTEFMAEQWDLLQAAQKERKLNAPKGGAVSKAFWGTTMSCLVGEQPMHVDGFQVYNALPYETKQLFLETWAEMIEENEAEREISANREIDDAGLQTGDLTDRGCYIGDKPKLTNATAATGISRNN